MQELRKVIQRYHLMDWVTMGVEAFGIGADHGIRYLAVGRCAEVGDGLVVEDAGRHAFEG